MMSTWLLECVSYMQVIIELFIYCPLVERRKFVLALVEAAVSTVSVQEAEEFLKRVLNKL